MSLVLDAPRATHTSNHPSRRLLLVAYAFPPVGGAGVQRPLKWVKYLHRAGWHVTVLTPENPSVPVIDASLLDEVPQETAFLRPRTWEPDYRFKQQLEQSSPGRAVPGTVRHAIERSGTPSATARGVWKRWLRAAASLVLQPDPQILWYRNAVRSATAHLRATAHDAILVTAPPYSSFLIGAALKRRCGLPLVLDYRDEWDLSSRYLENAQRDGVSRFVQERMQRAVLRQADAVVATTQASVRRLQERLDQIGHEARTACIYNGYDADDFERSPAFPKAGLPGEKPGFQKRPASETFRIVYTGTLWNLTTIAPLVTALEHLHRQSPELAARVELVCVGRKTPEQLALLDRLNSTSCRCVNVDYCDHATAIGWLQSADALCLLLSDVPGADRVVPAKLFEYLASRQQVLALMPDGEAAQIVRRFQPHGWFSPDNIPAIVAWLQTQTSCESRKLHRRGLRDDIVEFSRERQTERLLELLDEVTATAGRRS